MESMLSTTDSTTSSANQWNHQDDGVLVLNALEYVDVVSLIKKKPVCKQWKRLCTKSIDDKCQSQKSFQSNKELRTEVEKYSSRRFVKKSTVINPKDVEGLASKYGYPIGKWDVSMVEDFSYTFADVTYFNEPIGSWDVSNATTMRRMFSRALSFNQPIGYCDVSNVTDMSLMFASARLFNQDLSSWDISNVTNMEYMFENAKSFTKNLNKNLASWDVSNVDEFYRMFASFGCLVVEARRLPWFHEAMLG